MAKLAGFWLGSALGLALAVPALAQDAETVVATVNGTEITLGEMIVLREQLPEQYQALPDEVLFEGILDQLIQQTALAQTLEGNLSRRDQIAIENERRAYIASTVLSEAADAAVSDEALQQAYDRLFAEAEPTREYNAAHILVETEEEARALKSEIDGGADFAELAREHSRDGAAQGGGALGWFGPGMMVQPFEDAVTQLEVGEVSDPVQTQFGWHLVRLNETRMAEAPALDDVRGELAAELQREAIEARIAELTANAEITRNPEGIDPGVLRNQMLLD
ncbi:peptidylprolyl isomerase [Plastorhodobacter daqingensis]|uniref:Parvulin-like PPIase n=1 Tax=Plastorhodobacter daqingensis TaxID=1387281 RepID=A0ABW2UH09_9RHOB